jgi:hypothetical protein
MESDVSTWRYCRNGQQEGPVEFVELKGMIERGELADTSLVFKEGSSEWVRVRSHAELRALIPNQSSAEASAEPQTARPKALHKSILDAIRRKNLRRDKARL